MTSIKFTRTAKSGIAVAVSLALFLTSAGWPASQAFALALRGGPTGESASGARPVAAAPAALPAAAAPLASGSAVLAPSLAAVGAAPVLSAAPSVVSAASRSALPFSAAAASGGEKSESPKPAAGKPAEGAAPSKHHDETPAETPGPRWVKGESARLSLTSWVGRQVKHWTRADDAATVVPAAPARSHAPGLSKSESRADRIIDDSSIPTPQAAREVGNIRRERALPLWLKVAAPLSLLAAGAAAAAYGAVPVLTLAVGLIVSVLAHEVAHIAVLRKLGDHTAEEAGTHSLNPFNHIDPLKTVILPAISLAVSSAILPFPLLIGAGKAVDADFNNLHGPFGGPRSARNAFYAAGAGPLTNLALAGAAFAAFALLPVGGVAAGVALGLAKMNLALTVFNLLPLPQLDGGKMIASLLPERFYAKWVYNPKVEKTYQGMFRRLYEGPTALLTFMTDKLGIKSQRTLNRVANGVTFGALAAFYAVAYVHFSVAVPLLFLALPCTYDYWCIREKVRSEAAVNDVMQLYSEWAAVISQIAEDKGMESEVSLFEAEHAMKNALETLVDEMMAKEEFRALSGEDKLAAVLKAYPDKAAEFLKEKVFTEAGDTLEKVKELLADPRNEAYMNRLRKWFEDHNILERWDNPKYEGKLKEAVKAAGKEKGKSAGERGFAKVGVMAALAVLGGAAVLFPELAHAVPAWLSGLGVLGLMGALSPAGGGAASQRMARVMRDDTLTAEQLSLEFFAPMTEEEYDALLVSLTRDGLLAVFRDMSPLQRGAFTAAKLRFPTAGDAARAMELLRASPAVTRVGAPTAVFDRFLQLLSPAAGWTEKIRARAEGQGLSVEVRFDEELALENVVRHLGGRAGTETSDSDGRGLVATIPAATVEESAEIARHMAGLDDVARVLVAPSVAGRLGVAGRSEAPSPVAAPAAAAADAQAETEAEVQARAEAEAVDPSRWQGKVLGRDGERPGDVVVVFKPGAPKRAVAHVLKTLRDQFEIVEEGDYGRRVKTLRPDAAAEVARTLAGRKWVESVGVAPEVRDRVRAVALPAKVVTHGKEHYSVTAVLVKFGGETAAGEIKAVLGGLGGKRIVRHGDYYVLNAGDLNAAAQAAVALSGNEAVSAVEVHPNVAAHLEDRMIRPYPDAAAYDPAQSFFVQFKPGAAEETVKEYAELRRLRLVYGKFRGKEGLALFEVLGGADAAATRQILVDETLDEGSIVAEVLAFKEQPGEPAVVPSEAARAKAAARAAAASAQAEAEKNPPRRDPAAEWLAYLQNRKMADGTTLNDKQVKALAAYLRPLAKNPSEPRPPVVARTEEVKRLLPIVTSPRGMRNSVILVGEAGTGKTAVAEGLAEMIEDAEHAAAKDSEAFLQFQRLKGRWLVELDINKILTAEDPVGTLSAVLDLLPRFNDPSPSRGNEVIVLMDEIQKFFLDNSGQKIANVLKGPLRDGKIAVIATTTRKEYKEYIEKDDAFRRRFEKIDVEEPTVEQTISILRALKGFLQKLHDADISDESLTAAAKLADQFDKTNFNPDKAIKAVQDGAELSRPEQLRAAVTLDVRETWNQLVVAVNEARQTLADKAVASTLALPIEAYNRIAGLIKKAEALYAEREAVADGKGRVTVDVIKRVIAQKTGIGSGQLNMGEEDAARFNEMEKSVGERVVNQEPALTAIANAIRRNKAGLSNPSRPMGKFLLTGPTGVGKTYLAKELARFLFKDPEAMIRMDMSEYMEEHTAQRLTGSPPGYVGYGEGGQLTEAVRKKPYSVILFDEVEKAHPKVFDVLLQILDDGRLTDGEGRTIDFKNTVIIMTSNAGMSTVDGEKYARMLEAVEKHNESAELRAKNAAEIEAAWDKEIDEAVNESLKSRFRPEFLNRLDEDPRSKNKWIRVNRLRRQDITKIAQLQVKEFQDLLIDRHDTELQIDPSVIDFLSVEGFSPLYGARPMTAAIEKHIVDPMAKWILDEAAQGRKSVRGGLIRIKAEGGKIVFAAEAKPMKTLDRSAVEGASRQAAAEVFALIERLVGEGEGEEPSEGLFDEILRAARPKAPSASAAPVVPRAFFAPGSSLALPPSARTVAALHNKAKAADAAVRAEIKAVAEAVEKAGWTPEVLSAVSVPAGQVGEGWLKQFVAFAKGVAEKAGTLKPLEVASAVSADAVRLAVSFEAELTEADRAFLAAHFTGTPPTSYEAAQRAVDDLNLHSSIVRNHYLLDLYRRLRDIPGARMGYSSASGRGQIWLEIRKEEPKPADAAAAPWVSAAADGPVTPHQLKEMAKLRALFMRFIDQSRLQKDEQDGVSIRIAAAEAYARIAGPEEAELMRTWIRERGWSDPTVPGVKLGSESPLAMAAALVLQRLGGPDDAALLEGVLGKAGGLYGDAFTPLKTAFMLALAEVYKRSGLKATREASIRASQIRQEGDLAKQAAHRALGELGYPADVEDVRADGEALAQITRRMGKASELVSEFREDSTWNAADGARKTAILKLLGETAEPDQGTWDNLRRILQGYRGAGDRPVRYAAAQAWADLAARSRLTQGISAGVTLYLNEIGVREDHSSWAVMLAYVLALEKAGRAEDLGALERLMSIDPAHENLHFRHEQAYFAAAEAWAKVVVRSGKLAEYSRPQLGEDGAPKPSRLQEMLANKGKPLLVAAALRAMAIARDPSFKEKPAEPKGDAPVLHPGKTPPGGDGGRRHGGYGYGSYGARADMYERLFGGRRDPI